MKTRHRTIFTLFPKAVLSSSLGFNLDIAHWRLAGGMCVQATCFMVTAIHEQIADHR